MNEQDNEMETLLNRTDFMREIDIEALAKKRREARGERQIESFSVIDMFAASCLLSMDYDEPDQSGLLDLRKRMMAAMYV